MREQDTGWQLGGWFDDGELAPIVSDEDMLAAALGIKPDTGTQLKAWKRPVSSPRWVLVVPEGHEDLANALKPLVEHREGRVATMAEGVDLTTFVEAELHGEEHTPPDFVLLAGPATAAPFELDHRMAAFGMSVGRLSLDSLDDYATYADKVIAWDNVNQDPTPITVWGTEGIGRDPTRLSKKLLIDPLIEELKQVGVPIQTFVAAEATSTAGLDALRGSRGSLWVSASHGRARSDWTDAQRLAEQGALVGQDKEVISAAALGDGPCLTGGIALMFACFGGGTPAGSDYLGALALGKMKDNYTGKPFVAGLPKAMLARKEGPLAVIGHLDPVFSDALRSTGSGRLDRSGTFKQVAWDLLNRRSTGESIMTLHNMAMGFGDTWMTTSRELNAFMKDNEVGISELAKVPKPDIKAKMRKVVDAAVAHMDYRNFVILGDPAVKLPIPD